MKMKMTEVIASRDFVRIRVDNVREIFTVEFGTPVQAPNDAPGRLKEEYICPMRIIGYEKDPTVHIYFGRDTVEALQTAMSGAGVMLSGMPFAEEFVDAGVPNMGFYLDPMMVAMHGLKLTQKQQTIIQYIVERAKRTQS
jgi:hypothetical protein